jgi:hypothetical protein
MKHKAWLIRVEGDTPTGIYTFENKHDMDIFKYGFNEGRQLSKTKFYLLDKLEFMKLSVDSTTFKNIVSRIHTQKDIDVSDLPIRIKLGLE